MDFIEVLVVLKADESYQVDLRIDVDALAVGPAAEHDAAEIARALRAMSPEDLDAAIERARRTVGRRAWVRFDGVKQSPDISFPFHGVAVSPGVETVPTVLGSTARLSGSIPDGSIELTIGTSAVFPTVHLTITEEATGGGAKHIVSRGGYCPPYRLNSPPQTPDWLQVTARYLILGFQHIVPRGLDHILFVVGLFLLSTKVRPLLWQITAFTIAHSVTLALSMYDVVSLPSRLVESLIALSIVFVGVENLMTTQLKPRRVVLVFGFGLLHGLGFASVLRELGLPSSEFVTALITFNIGVELGQLTVVLLCLLTVGWFRQNARYRKVVVIPASAMICVVALYWLVQRALLGG
ncbi:MAG: HupE/UreJ family protein [Planctomycetes bacterium]|nr:HupE/UreJ family protein [Planctomycetota bacterium]